MYRVFDRLDYASVNGFEDDDWDVLWNFEYPFESKRTPELRNKTVKPLKPHQKLNHIPGIAWIGSKSWMTTRNREIKTILSGFQFPHQIEEFKKFVMANPEAKFVVKHFENRGIKLVNHSDINFEKSDSFYQLFMERPLLIDRCDYKEN